MKIYVISLERAVERRSRVESVLAARGIDFEFFNAVNGFEGLPERLQALPDDQHRIRFRSRPLTPGEGLLCQPLPVVGKVCRTQ